MIELNLRFENEADLEAALRVLEDASEECIIKEPFSAKRIPVGDES